MRLLILLFTLTLSIFATPSVSITTNDINLNEFEVEYFVDQSHTMQLPEVKKAQFTPSIQKNSLGLGTIDVWLRVRLDNKTKQRQKLFLHNEYGYSYLKIEYYELQNEKILKQEVIDLEKEPNNTIMHGKSAVFEVNLEPNSQKVLYIKTTAVIYTLFKLGIYDAKNSKMKLMNANVLIVILVGFLFSLLTLRTPQHQ